MELLRPERSAGGGCAVRVGLRNDLVRGSIAARSHRGDCPEPAGASHPFYWLLAPSCCASHELRRVTGRSRALERVDRVEQARHRLTQADVRRAPVAAVGERVLLADHREVRLLEARAELVETNAAVVRAGVVSISGAVVAHDGHAGPRRAACPAEAIEPDPKARERVDLVGDVAEIREVVASALEPRLAAAGANLVRPERRAVVERVVVKEDAFLRDRRRGDDRLREDRRRVRVGVVDERQELVRPSAAEHGGAVRRLSDALIPVAARRRPRVRERGLVALAVGDGRDRGGVAVVEDDVAVGLAAARAKRVAAQPGDLARVKERRRRPGTGSRSRRRAPRAWIATRDARR